LCPGSGEPHHPDDSHGQEMALHKALAKEAVDIPVDRGGDVLAVSHRERSFGTLCCVGHYKNEIIIMTGHSQCEEGSHTKCKKPTKVADDLFSRGRH